MKAHICTVVHFASENLAGGHIAKCICRRKCRFLKHDFWSLQSIAGSVRDISLKCTLFFTRIGNFHWCQNTTDFGSHISGCGCSSSSWRGCLHPVVSGRRYTGPERLNVRLLWKYLSLSFGHTTGGTGENFADLKKNAGVFFFLILPVETMLVGIFLCHTTFRYLRPQQQWVASRF